MTTTRLAQTHHRHALFRALAPVLLACAAGAAGAAPAQPQPSAPEIPTGLSWYNTTQPLTLAELRGRAVLLDFFSPGCINCIHMLPLEARLEQHFGEQLVVIGVDSPKFSASTSAAAVKSFIARHQLTHPVVLDYHSQVWNAYGVNAWPTLVLIGPAGQVLTRFVGDHYSFQQLATPIRDALADAPAATTLAALPAAPAARHCHFLSMPAGLAVSPRYVAIADTGHGRVVLANHSGQVLRSIGAGTTGHAAAHHPAVALRRPHGLAFHEGALYVADTGANRIVRIPLGTGTARAIAGNGQRAYVNEGEFDALQATLNSPWGLAWYGGRLYISMAGDHQIWRFDPATGKIGPWAGTGAEGLRDGRLYNAAFAQPSGLTVHAGVLYDADAESSAIRATGLAPSSPSPDFVTTVAGPVHGLFNFGLKDGPAREALLQHPQDLSHANGAIYIADTYNDAIRKLDLKTGQLSTPARVPRPLAIARLDDRVLLIASGDGIMALNTADDTLRPWHIEAPASSPACAD